MPDYSIEQILKLSRNQGCTCMYSKEELATFPQERLNSIYLGIAALENRKPWKSAKALRGAGSIKRWMEFAPCKIGG